MRMTNKEWRRWLERKKQEPSFIYAYNGIIRESKRLLIFPKEEFWFRPLEQDIEKVDVVITGTRPVGIPAFSRGYAYSSLGEETLPIKRFHYNFRRVFGYEPKLDKEDWIDKGILLLNRELTSSSYSGQYGKRGNPHKRWISFTQSIVQRLLNDTKERVFILADDYGYESLQNPHNHPVFYSLEEGFIYLKETHPTIFGG